MLGHKVLWDAAVQPIKDRRYATARRQAFAAREHVEMQVQGVLLPPEFAVSTDGDI
ncbi:MAG: hypothetical protein AAFR35_14865 [Pseudomonadota bacterium]